MCIKFCGCKGCRAGKHRPSSKARTKRAARSFKRQGKAALRKGNEPITKISAPYTD